MICSASIAHLAGNTMPTPPIARGGNTASRPTMAGMVGAIRDANDYFLLWRSHSMALMRNVLLSSSL